ncbi:MAG: YraN family protein [Syntrophobacteraceae bacterium]
MMKEKNRSSKGKEGEDAAVAFLMSNGLEIRERNFRCPAGEIDIVASDRRSTIFVEVRSRHTDRFGSPEESIVALKRRRIVQAAHWYLKKHCLFGSPARIDVVTIRWKGKEPDVTWIPNAIESHS